MFHILRQTLAIALFASAALGADAELDATFKRIDQAAAGFKGFKANIRKVAHTDVVGKDDIDSGTIAVQRVKNHELRIRMDLKDPRQQTVTIGQNKVIVFSPLINEAQKADLGQYRNLANQLFLLGFGSTSADLQRAYSVSYGGAESINGMKTARIELIPKDKDLLDHIKKCELWISPDGVTVQQKLFTGGGDYNLATYSNIDTHTPVKDSDVELHLPKSVKNIPLK
jgi:outer membrane lipoprotein-sorting protein